MKEKNKKEIRISFMGMLLFLCLSVIVPVKEALAASAVVSLSTGETEVLKGDRFSVTVTVESADDIGNVELFVVFDASKVSFVDNGKYTIGGDGLVLISDWNDSADSTRKKYMLEFEAKKKGTCKFSVGDQPAIYLADTEEPMSVSSVNMSVEVVKELTEAETEKETQEVTLTEKTTSDKMAELQNIVIAEGTLTPEFDSSITAYRVNVPNEVDRLSMSTLAASAQVGITVNGNENFVVGENIVSIVVEAENGAKKEYIITVVREEAKAEGNGTVGDGRESKSGVYISETEDGVEITQYTKLTVKKVEDTSIIPDGYMKTSIRLGEVPMIAYIPENDIDSKNYLIYATDGLGNTGFYEYNRAENTLKKYMADDNSTTSGNSSEVLNANFQMMTAIIALLILCAVLSVALVLQLVKKRQFKKEPEEAEDDIFKDYL